MRVWLVGQSLKTLKWGLKIPGESELCRYFEDRLIWDSEMLKAGWDVSVIGLSSLGPYSLEASQGSWVQRLFPIRDLEKGTFGVPCKLRIMKLVVMTFCTNSCDIVSYTCKWYLVQTTSSNWYYLVSRLTGSLLPQKGFPVRCSACFHPYYHSSVNDTLWPDGVQLTPIATL